MKQPVRTKRIIRNRFARMREIMAEYGFPLRIVMRGMMQDGRFYLTNKTR